MTKMYSASRDHVCKISLGSLWVGNHHNHSLHNYCNYGDRHYDCKNYYHNYDNYYHNYDNCSLSARCLRIFLIRNVLTVWVDKDLHCNNVIQSHDTRFDACCSGPYSSLFFSPHYMQHALYLCEDVSVCQVEYLVFFAFLLSERKTTPHCKKKRKTKIVAGIIKGDL